MKIFAIEKELHTDRDFKPHLISEAKKVWELYQSGFIREIYFTKGSHCAVLILESDDKLQAEKILNSLPLVKEGLISFEIQELIPYDGFSRLFTNQN
jgi:hypothetical protein